MAGLAGAVSVVVLDSILSRVNPLGHSVATRAATRLALAGAASMLADAYGAPDAVAEGLFAGAVTVTALDAGVALIGSSRTNPPDAGLADAGAPWAPSPAYALR